MRCCYSNVTGPRAFSWLVFLLQRYVLNANIVYFYSFWLSLLHNMLAETSLLRPEDLFLILNATLIYYKARSNSQTLYHQTLYKQQYYKHRSNVKEHNTLHVIIK